jgi:hypothetical protein
MSVQQELLAAAQAIARRDPDATRLLRASPGLAREPFRIGASRASSTDWFLVDIAHYVYAGDTLLHIAAAAYATDVARALVGAGADVRARNRRGAEPLHYACDGGPGAPTWDPRRQASMVKYLIDRGASPDALDASGVAPLHRAARTRCTGAVRALLAGGADPRLRNEAGSTALDLASTTTGRGGSGSREAKREQAIIVRLLSS